MTATTIIDWIPVSSSNLRAVAYNEALERLHVEFHNGAGYYDGVPLQVFDALLAAPSKGQFLHRSLKPAYRWTKTG